MNFRQTVCKMKYPDFDSDNPFEKYVKILFFFYHSTQIFLKKKCQSRFNISVKYMCMNDTDKESTFNISL